MYFDIEAINPYTWDRLGKWRHKERTIGDDALTAAWAVEDRLEGKEAIIRVIELSEGYQTIGKPHVFIKTAHGGGFGYTNIDDLL